MKRDGKMVPITLRLGAEHLEMLGYLSRTSGESTHAVLRVLMALSIMRLKMMGTLPAPGKKKPRTKRGKTGKARRV